MKTDWESPSPDIRIEILPLIDVIFCILTFFILASVVLTRQSGINVDLPSASSATTQMREMRIISIDPFGQLFWEQTPITEARLIQQLQEYKATNPLGLIVLYASRSASYEDVVDVLDLLREEWGDQVALATQPQGEGTSDFEGTDFPEEFDPFSDELEGSPLNNQDLLDQRLDQSEDFFEGAEEGAIPGVPSLDKPSTTDRPGLGEDSELETVPPSDE